MGIFDRLDEELKAAQTPVTEQETQINQGEQIDPDKEVDFNYNDMSKDEGQMEAVREQALGQEVSPDMFTQDDQEVGQYVDARMIDMGINEQFANSLSRGVGTVLGGFGDLFQAVPGVLGGWVDERAWRENTLSDFFHGLGDRIQTDNQNFVPEEFKDISLSTLGSVKGWQYLITNQIAETLPYMAEFILTGMGAGAMAKKGATTYAKKKLKKMAIQEAVKKGAIKKVFKDGGEEVLKNSAYKAGGVTDRLRRALLSENGLSKTGEGLASTIGAGAANNQLIALTQSAEAVNEAKMYKDDEGNPMFNEEELAQIGADTWQTEFAYIGADILSWGFTFGKIPTGSFAGIGIKGGKSLTKTTGARISKVLSKMGIEGAEESVQETWEEWSKKSSIDLAKLNKGLITEEEYLNSDVSKGFFDYYTAKENEGVLIVSALMGGLMAGGKASIDLMAEKSSLLRDKSELVKAQFNGENEGEFQDEQKRIRQLRMAELVKEDRHDSLDNMYKEWVESGSATEEEYKEFTKNTNKFVELFNRSQNLNIEGANRLYDLMIESQINDNLLEEAKKVHAEELKELKSLKLGKEAEVELENSQKEDLEKKASLFSINRNFNNKLIKEIIKQKSLKTKKELDESNKRLKKLSQELIDLKEQIKTDPESVLKAQDAAGRKSAEVENFILGKKFVGVKNEETGEFETDKKTGEILGEGFDDQDYQRYTETGEEQAKNESKLQNGIDKSKSLFSKGVESVKGLFKKKTKEEEPKNEEETNEEEEEVKPGEEVKPKPKVEEEIEFSPEQEAEFEDSLEDENDLFDALIFRARNNKNNQSLQDTFLNKFAPKNKKGKHEITKETKAKIEKFQKYYKEQEAVGDNLATLEERVKTKRKAFKPTGSKVVELTEEQKKQNAFDNAEEAKGKQKRKSNPNKNNVKGNFRKEDAPKDVLEDQDEEVESKDDNKSEGRKKLEEKAKKEGKNLITVAREKFNEIKEAIKNAKNSKEVEEFLAELEAIEEIQQFRGSSLFKSLIKLKNEATINGSLMKLKEILKKTKNLDTRRSIVQQIRAIENERKVRKFNKKPTFITKKVTPETRRNLFTMSEVMRLNGASAEPGINSKLSIIRKNLKKSHPDLDLVMVDDLKEVIGVDGVAYVLGNTIYIDPRAVNQPAWIAHEMAHVYYSLTKEDESTKRLVKQLSNNVKKVEDIKSKYWDQLYFKLEKNGEESIGYPITDEYLHDNLEGYIASKQADGYTVTEMPLEEQEVIKDELFAYYTENKIAGEYDAYFEPTNKKKRLQFYEKGFWRNVKNKLSLGFVESTQEQETLEYLKDLDIDGIPSTTENLGKYIAKEFKKGFNAKTYHSSMRQGRRRRETKTINTQLDKDVENSIKGMEEIFENESLADKSERQLRGILSGFFDKISDVKTPEGRSNFVDQYNQDLINEDGPIDDFLYTDEEVATGILDDKADVYNKTITQQFNEFIEDINRRRIKKGNEDLLDRNQIAGPVRFLAAQHFDSNLDFIEAMENSSSDVIANFLQWLNIKHEDEYKARLVSMHTNYANNHVMDSFLIKMSENGIDIVSGLATEEINRVDNLIKSLNESVSLEKKLNKEKDPVKKKTVLLPSEQAIVNNLKAFKTVARKIKKNVTAKVKKEITDADFDVITKALFPYMDLNPEMKEVLIDGNFKLLKTAIIDGVAKATTLDRVANQNTINEYVKLDSYKLRPLFNAAIAGNRVYSGAMMAKNAEGNDVSLEQKNMFLVNENKRIARDIASGMTEKQFSKKYNNNPLAMKYFKDKSVPKFMQTLGIESENKGTTYQKTISDGNFLGDLILFIKSNKDSYLQSMPINGESARRYYTMTSKIIVSSKDAEKQAQINKDLDRKFTEAAILAVRNGDERFGKPRSKNSSKGQKLKSEINKEYIRLIKNFEENPELIDEIQKKTNYEILNENNKISEDGKTILKSYALNHTLNQIYAKDLYYSGISEQDMAKRSKGAGAPNTPINSSGQMKLGILNVLDFEVNVKDLVGVNLKEGEFNTTDSMNFLLPEDTERVQGIYGSGMKVGKILKMFSFSTERENPKAMNKGVTIKGLTFTLTDDFVNDNPGYKPLRDALRAQRKHYIDNYNDSKPLPFNLNNGLPNFLPLAVASSSLKTGGIENNGVTIEELKDTKNALSKINALNEYPGDYGFNGSDIGIQNLMDKPYEQAIMAQQLMSNLFNNSANLGTLGRVEGMQKRIRTIAENNVKNKIIKYLPKDANNLTNSDLNRLKQFLIDSTNPDLVDPVTLNVLKEYTVSLPYLQNKVSQIMKNKIVRTGLRLYTDGTVGLQMADFGMFESSVNQDTGLKEIRSSLKSYGTGENSASWIDSSGNVQQSTVPGESLISYEFAEKAGTRLRQSFEGVKAKTRARNEAKKIATKNAAKLGLVNKKKDDYINKHTAILFGDNNDGTYFVRGEMYLGTRIPSHGLQTTLVLEAKGTLGKGMGSGVVVNSELSSIMGSDYDGDALYMNMSNGTKGGENYESKQALKEDMIDYLTDEVVQKDLLITLDIKKIGIEVNKEILAITNGEVDLGLDTSLKGLSAKEAKAKKDRLNKLKEESSYLHTPTGQKESFKDNVETKKLVGIAASLHRFLNVLSAYETPFGLDININGVNKTSFKDEGDGNIRSTKTALLLNVILDNAKNKIAEKLGITPATAPQYVLLAGMGYDIPTISAIMRSEGAKAWIKASNNRNNQFVEQTGKFEVLDKAKKIAGVSGKLNKDQIKIDSKNLNSVDGKKNVIQLLSSLDDMQSEAFKVNKILSTHKKIESNPYLLEEQIEEFEEFIKGNGIFKYTKEFREGDFVMKYKRAVDLALDVNRKTNISYSATGREFMKHIKGLYEGDFKSSDYNFAQSKIIKALYKDAFKENFDFSTSEINERLYGENSVFKRLIHEVIKSKTEKGGKRMLLENLVVVDQDNTKRISLNKDVIKHGNDRMMKVMRKQFMMLPEDLKNDLIIYDFVVNGLQGSNSIFPIFDDSSIQVLGESFNILLSKNARSKNMETIKNQKTEILMSLHSIFKKVPYDPKTNKYKKIVVGSELFESIVKNEEFIRTVEINGKRYVTKFVPLDQEDITRIRTKNNDYEGKNPNINSQIDMVKEMRFTRIGPGIDLSTLNNHKNPLFNDINILNAEEGNSNPNPEPTERVKNPNFKKKSSGRSRLEGSEDVTHRMSREQWNLRNDLSGISEATNASYKEYLKQYDKAKAFFESDLKFNQAVQMSDEQLEAIDEEYSTYQAEASSIVRNVVETEIASRNASRHAKTTGAKEGGDLSVGQKWFISSNIPSRLPGIQAMAKKVGERFKEFLRRRSQDYEAIDKVTKALYKSKFNNSFVKFNPFKGKKHYEQLYGNLVVKEKVGEGVNNMRLKDRSVIERMFKNGELSKEEKDFYDVFSSITEKYKGLLDGKDDRRGYIPHTKQSLLESYSNRGVLGAFMNSQTTEDKVRDVKLKGYDPISDSVVTQTFKKFEDSYNAASENKEFGNQNKWKAKDLAMLKFKAKRLQKKGINEDGTEIKMSSFSIDTLANSGTRNRFTNQRSNKATLFPSMDLNKAIMDFTHSSAFAESFRDMLPEIQGLITYHKKKGDKNAVSLLETYYRDKIIRGKNPTGPFGKTVDKGIKIVNMVVVFKLLGLQTAFVTGNVLAGKYHNLKNGKKGEWAKGEKRFWGFDGAESGPMGWVKNFKSSIEFLKKIGFMEQNIYEDINLEKEWNPINKLQTLALLPMTLSEKWIQGVQFLGMLSDEEWNAWKNEGKMISVEKQSQYEDDVKKSQGRGYNYTDQRMISLYSLGQVFMMFNKFIPTMMADRFNQEEIDAYGRKNIGSLRQFGKTATDVISGRMSYGDFKEYRKNLPDHKKEALDKAVKGMALVTVAALVGAGAGAAGDDDLKYAMDGVVMDANYAINFPKLARKMSNIPTVSVVTDAVNQF